jgi:hypothetical protein
MALYGANIESSQDDNVIKLQEECLSCNGGGDALKVTKLFKVACIGYKCGDL